GSGALAVELDWDAAPEGTVNGYEVWKGVTQVCTASLNTYCMDTSPASSGTTTYTIKTDYTDGAGTPQQMNTTYNTTAPGSGSLATTYWLTTTNLFAGATCITGNDKRDSVPTAPTGATDS